MVGYDPKSKLTYSDVAIAGAASGFITRALCQPLDVLKIRFQLQVEPISKCSGTAKYRSMAQAIHVILQEEGVRAFWKGHVPAQWLSIVYGLGQFWCFEFTSKLSHDFGFKRNQASSNFVCGSAAGAFATVLSFPFDVIRTRLVAQSETNKTYKGVIHGFYNICRYEHGLVLFRGLFPTIIQVAPHTGVQFMTYKLFELIYHRFVRPEILPEWGDVLASSVVCGSLAGLCAKSAIYPLDLAKKRMQIQGFDRKLFGRNFICNGLIDCLRNTVRFEGFLGLYKGLAPSLIKAVVTSALHFSTYELICLEIRSFR